jgi:hypothetical protein
MERRPPTERLHRSQGDSSHEGKSVSDIIKLTTQEVSVQPKHENVTGTVGRAGGTERITKALQNVMLKSQEASKMSAAPEARIAGPSERGSETRNIASENLDLNLDKKFKNATALYGHAYTMMEEATRKRLIENPNPTPEELDRGIFNEELYPQFIDAIPLMWSKGYETWSSEPKILLEEFKSPLAIDRETARQESLFAGKPQEVPEGMLGEILRTTPNVTLKGEGKDHYRIQQIDGSFYLDKATIEKIEALGAQAEVIGVGDNAYSRIFFEADEETTLRSIKATCDKIAAILPDKGQPAPQHMTQGAIAFREKYGRNTHVAHMTKPGALDIPGRSARETAAREASSTESSSSSSASSFEMDL